MTDTPTSTPTAPAAPAPVDPAPINPTTPAEARARIDQLDRATRNGANAGSRAALPSTRNISGSRALADQADEVKDAIAGTTPEPNLIETVGPGQLNSRAISPLPLRCSAT